MSDVIRAYRVKIKVRCDRCGRTTSEEAGAYKVMSGPCRGIFHTKQCYEIARKEMETGQLNKDTQLPTISEKEVEDSA